jgi:hypothetical protein
MHKNVYTFFQSVQVKIELGHRASQRENPSPDGYTHDWTVYVRGPEGCINWDLSRKNLKFGLTTDISRKKSKDIIQIKIKEPPTSLRN